MQENINELKEKRQQYKTGKMRKMKKGTIGKERTSKKVHSH